MSPNKRRYVRPWRRIKANGDISDYEALNEYRSLSLGHRMTPDLRLRSHSNSVPTRHDTDDDADLPGGANRVMVHRCTSMHDADFDPSRENLMRLFQLLDSNGSGLLTQSKLESFEAGKEDTDTNEVFTRKVIASIKANKPLNLEEFINVARERAALLFVNEEKSPFSMPAPKLLLNKHLSQSWRIPIGHVLSVYDYCPETLKIAYYDNIEEYMTDQKDLVEGWTRLLRIKRSESTAIMRLADQCNIHPLQLEDALNPTQSRLKVDMHPSSDLLHVLLAVLSLNTDETKDNRGVVIHNSIIMMEHLVRRLSFKGSKLRMHETRFLLYSIVDAAIDAVFPILESYHQRLSNLQADVHSNRDTALTTVTEIQQINRDMNMIQFYVKPMEPVVSQLMAYLSEGSDDPLYRYLEDLLGKHCYNHTLP
eukprot:525840_1